MSKNGRNKAVVYPNPDNDIDFKMAKHACAILERSNWDITLCAYPEHPGLDNTDILITFGGDGTILHAARDAAVKGVPILGVNMGGKGFIAELEPGDIDVDIMTKVATGQYSIEKRMMIDVEIERNGKVIYSDYALNDVVIKGDNKVIDIAVFADGQRITRFSGDGTIIATPTGSTAYSMSAGGPIVEPTAENIIITPICAHTLEAKTFVLTSKRKIAVEIEHKSDVAAFLSVDGGAHTAVKPADVVQISKSEKSTSLVNLSGQSFYHRLSSKLISRIN